ncbi:MAG: hypothetical protein FWG09_07965 [Synergistaceae bacterium]|nr:hypothetical protein [Synergistaceae bacterium]
MPNYESFKLFRILGGEAKQIDTSDKRRSKSQQEAYLVPFRMLSVSGFKFPFSNPVKIREAIKLQTVSYSGGNSIQIFPVTVNKNSMETSGFSFFIPDNELIELEEITGNTSSPIFPAPLSLASSVSGNGITVWTDEKNICSVIWRSGIPELYRWRAKKESALESEISWLKKYCESKEIEEKNDVYIFDAEKDLGNLHSIIRESFAAFPWLRDINLSRGAINSVMLLERFVRFASKAAVWLAVLGAVFAFGGWMNYSMLSKALDDTRSNSEKLYRDVFDKDGRIVDPVSQARGRINALLGSGSSGKTLSDFLSDLGVPWQINPISITIDFMRYNSEGGADLSGSAADMATIQSFRTALADMGGSVQLGDVSQIPGGGFRFNLGIKWE